MNLVIVESPTKAKTISRFLGSDFVVKSSYGHVRDLPKSKIGVDVKADFTPTYIIPDKAKKVVRELADEADAVSRVILATDEDREGEAIAWHLIQALGLENPNAQTQMPKIDRIVFHEITKSAIEEALKNPRDLDMKLVDAQQARRILDRLVGYELSPFLWRKIRYGLSAGRVQSAALRMLVEREREIEKFQPQEYWDIAVQLAKKNDGELEARLVTIDSGELPKPGIPSKEETEKIVSELNGAKFEVAEVSQRETARRPLAPFTTSTLQQTAWQWLRFSARQTMLLAQQLYEGIDLGDGPIGLITYMRTDSTHLSRESVMAARDFLVRELGERYALPEPRFFATKSKLAQEAHEAIRPTDPARTPESLKTHLSPRQYRLYDLIWRRFVASQMPEARLAETRVIVDARNTSAAFGLRASGQTIAFDGYLKIWPSRIEEKILPKGITEGDALDLIAVVPAQHFTEPPSRYTDASLVKALEEYGIGRPSTYAPTISTLETRGYLERDEKRSFRPTDVGKLVTELLEKHFPDVVDYGFTATIEDELDEIAEGKRKWIPVVREFYGPFKKHLVEKEISVEKHVEISDTPCPHCGKPMLIKFGRMGKFLACPDPESKVTLPMPEEAAKIKELAEKTKDEKCPICGGPMEVKRGRFGYFLGCMSYPQCKGVAKIWEKSGFKCPNCSAGDIVLKKSRGRKRPFWACTRYPECTFVMNKKPESETALQEALEHWKANPPQKRGKRIPKKR